MVLRRLALPSSLLLVLVLRCCPLRSLALVRRLLLSPALSRRRRPSLALPRSLVLGTPRLVGLLNPAVASGLLLSLVQLVCRLLNQGPRLELLCAAGTPKRSCRLAARA